MPKFPNSVSYHGSKSTKTRSGQARFATDTEAAAGTDESLLISPATLASAVDDLVPTASLTVAGIVELATAAEMLAGVDTGRVPAVNVVFDYINSVTTAGAPAWSESVSGIGQLSTSGEATTGTNDTTAMTPLKVAAVFAAPPAIGSGSQGTGEFSTLAATGAINFDAGGSFESGGAAIDIGADASADAINVGTGGAARTITIGNNTTTTAVAITSGTGHITLTSTGAGDIITAAGDKLTLDAVGTVDINSSGAAIGIGNNAVSQAINIGTGAAARTITVGNDTGASSFVVTAGTGAVNIGVNGIAHTTSIGNKTGASALVLDVGTGNFALDGVGASTYTVGAATTTGTIDIGGTAGTGTMTFGDSSGTQIVQIGSGEGASTVAIAGGATNPNAVDVGIGAVANVIRIGTVSGAASLALKVGTGNYDLDGAASSTYTIGASTTTGTIDIGGTAQTGTMTLGDSSGTNIVQIGSGEGLTTVNIAGGATNAKTVNIGTGAVANVLTLGSVSGAASLDLLCGTGNFTLEGDVASTYAISGTGANTGTITIGGGTGAQTLNMATGATGIKTVNLGTGAIGNVVTIGTVTAAASLDLLCGTGNFTVEGNVASTYEISSTGANTGTCKFASGTGARTVEIGGGGTGIKTINIGAAATADVITIGTTTAAGTTTLAAGTGGVVSTGPCIYTPDSITSDNAGVAASVSTVMTLITTDGDSNLDNVTLADGTTSGQIKHFAIVAVGNAADSVKITPANMFGGTQITFSADPSGLGCSFVFDGTNWTCFANNGGTIA